MFVWSGVFFYDRLMAQKKERLLKMETQQVLFMGIAMIEH